MATGHVSTFPAVRAEKMGRENMDQVNAVNGLGAMQPARRMKAAYRMSDAPAPTDSVEVSSEVMRLRGVEGVRLDRVMAVKSQIAAGNYFTAEKFDIALDRAIDQLFGG
jgi:anti-sigma28 factor (negative regulator of flagellin synthesis)